MKPRIWLALGIAAIGWGTGSVATRAALNDGVPPVGMVAVRAIIAATVIASILTLQRDRWFRKTSSWKAGAVLAITNLVVPFILFTYALRYASAGFVGLLAALVPIISAVVAHYFLPDEPLRTTKVLALLIGFGGVGLMVLSGDSGLATGGRPLLAVGLSIVAVFLLGISNVYAKTKAASYHAMTLMTVQFGAGAAVLTVVALVVEGLPSISTWGFMLILYMALAATVIPYIMYYWMLPHVTSTQAATIGYIVPLVTLASGIVLLDERLEFGIAAGGVVILVGVILTHRAERESVGV